MELKIKLNTPSGLAGSNDWKFKLIKGMLFKGSKIKKEEVSKEKDSIIYTIEVHPRRFLKVVRSVSMFDNILKQAIKNRMLRKQLKKLANTEEDYKKVLQLCKEKTHIEILKD